MKKVFILIVSALILGLLFTGCVAKISSPATVNTDGDLYKCECFGGETATGLGDKIKPKGTWFMYNEYPAGPYGYWYWDEDEGIDIYVYQIQAGNPKNGPNIIGQYWIWYMGDGWYWAKYWINPVFVVVDEHLAISDSDTMNFTAAPGRDDNQDFKVPFYDEDGKFYIFAHFAVECAK